jgi:hypothetical protein
MPQRNEQNKQVTTRSKYDDNPLEHEEWNGTRNRRSLIPIYPQRATRVRSDVIGEVGEDIRVVLGDSLRRVQVRKSVVRGHVGTIDEFTAKNRPPIADRFPDGALFDCGNCLYSAHLQPPCVVACTTHGEYRSAPYLPSAPCARVSSSCIQATYVYFVQSVQYALIAVSSTLLSRKDFSCNNTHGCRDVTWSRE